MRKFTGREI